MLNREKESVVNGVAHRPPWFGVLAVLASVATVLVMVCSASGQQPPNTNKIIPLIVMDDVPLSDAIANLARQAGINYILDPQLTDLTGTVSGRWTNSTAEQVLGTTRHQHGFIMIGSPSNSASLIVPTNQPAKPLGTNSAGTATNSAAAEPPPPSGK